MLMKISPMCKALGLEAERYKSHTFCLLRVCNSTGQAMKKVK